MLRLLVVAFLSFFCFPVGADSTPVSLDSFLSGVEICDYDRDFNEFFKSLWEEDSEGVYRVTPVEAKQRLPAKIRANTGDIRIVRDEPEFQIISVGINGVWHGVQVDQLEFFNGKGSGFLNFFVYFGGPIGKALDTFQPFLNKFYLENPDNGEVRSTLTLLPELHVRQGVLSLSCD